MALKVKKKFLNMYSKGNPCCGIILYNKKAHKEKPVQGLQGRKRRGAQGSKLTNYTRKERKKKTLDYHDSFCLPGGGLPE
jgi:hypothetical protein